METTLYYIIYTSSFHNTLNSNTDSCACSYKDHHSKTPGIPTPSLQTTSTSKVSLKCSIQQQFTLQVAYSIMVSASAVPVISICSKLLLRSTAPKSNRRQTLAIEMSSSSLLIEIRRQCEQGETSQMKWYWNMHAPVLESGHNYDQDSIMFVLERKILEPGCLELRMLL